MAYTSNQLALRRWDNILNNLRNDVASLKKIFLGKISIKGSQGILVSSDGKINSHAYSDGILLSNNGIISSSNIVSANSFGLGRIHLINLLNFTEVDVLNVIIDTSNWAITYQFPSFNTLLLNGHHCTVPTSINGISLVGANVYLEASLNMTIIISALNTEEPFMNIMLVKNDTETTSIAYYANFDSVEPYNKTIINITLNDVIECTGGDTIDIFLATSHDVKMYICSGSNYSYANFSIKSILC